jgi:hypothetical protein
MKDIIFTYLPLTYISYNHAMKKALLAIIISCIGFLTQDVSLDADSLLVSDSSIIASYEIGDLEIGETSL